MTVSSSLPLSGPILDSRVVGDILLVATNDGWDSTEATAAHAQRLATNEPAVRLVWSKKLTN
jgi:hypothetical protein